MLTRNKVVVSGLANGKALIFIHGFGCDQSMWRQVAPDLAEEFQIVTYDLTGMGQSDLSAYDPHRYANPRGHAEDLLAIIEELGLDEVVLIGHPVRVQYRRRLVKSAQEFLLVEQYLHRLVRVALRLRVVMKRLEFLHRNLLLAVKLQRCQHK